jgi:hypothetical protein
VLIVFEINETAPGLRVNGRPAFDDPIILSHISGEIPGPFVYKLSDYLPPMPMLSRLDPDASDDIVLDDIDGMIQAMRAESPQAAVECSSTTNVAVVDPEGVRWLRLQAQAQAQAQAKLSPGLQLFRFLLGCVGMRADRGHCGV